MKKILNQFDAQGIRSGMATPSCCSCCCCSCVGTLSAISSEMIIRSDDTCGHVSSINDSEHITFSTLSYLKRVLLFTAPVLLSFFLLALTKDENILLPVVGGIVVYYLGLIIYFAKKSQMTTKQYIFLALRTVILFSVEFGVVLYCFIEKVTGFTVAAIAFAAISLFEYQISLKRGVTQKNAIRQTGVTMGVFILVYLITVWSVFSLM